MRRRRFDVSINFSFCLINAFAAKTSAGGRGCDLGGRQPVITSASNEAKNQFNNLENVNENRNTFIILIKI